MTAGPFTSRSEKRRGGRDERRPPRRLLGLGGQSSLLRLVGFLVVLRRRGVPLLWGRRALVVWMLVVLLHWTAGAPAQPATIDAPHATGILFLLPATATPLIAAAAALLFITFATAHAAPTRRVWHVAPPPRIGRTRSCCSRQLVPRAPPVSIT